MFKSYLKTALRNLRRHRGATIIKLAGLSIGMSCCMLILVYINEELSFNKFNTHYEGIYRVNFIKQGDGETRIMAGTPDPAGPAIAQDLPQVDAVARLYNRSGILEARSASDTPVKNSGDGGRRRFQEAGIFLADNSIFRIFSFRFREGGPAEALAAPHSVVLTGEMARKYFGDAPALGRSLLYENKQLLRVTGVVDKMPSNSDIQFDALVSFDDLYSIETKPAADFLRTNWLFNPSETFVLLHPGIAREEVDKALRQVTLKYGDERVRKSYYLALQPLAQIHLHASGVESNESTNSITYIYIFAAIALLILLIANINFINLSNAQSLSRIAEIGVRKVSGADSRQLLLQFLGEGMLLSLGAFLVAFILVKPGLRLLNEITGKDLHPAVLWRISMLAMCLLLFLLSGLLAGLYPAIFITRFRLTALLKGQTGRSAGKGKRIRQSLIVTQFTIAISLIIGAIVIQRQLQFLRNKPLGFDKEQLVVLPLFGKNPSAVSSGVDGPLRARMNAFENDLRGHPSIRAVTLSSALPGDLFVRGLVIPQGHVEQDNIFVPWASVDYDFIQTIGAPIIAGRDFLKATGTDHLQAFIINESAIRTFGWKSASESIGKEITRGDSQNGKKGHVIGVIKDFNFGRLDRPQEPLILDVNVPRFTVFAVRISPAGVPKTLEIIREAWNQYFPERVYEYSFLDQNIDGLYKAQENLSRLVGYFAVIAIFISCIGLFSLASYMAIQRTREIGIRKVLGASKASLVALLFRDFLWLVVIALAIAAPLAGWAMQNWLHDFAYRIGLSWWIFGVTGILAISISLLTVGVQGFRAAAANPARSLRSE
jgi:putative ABC transport system permease protein